MYPGCGWDPGKARRADEPSVPDDIRVPVTTRAVVFFDTNALLHYQLPSDFDWCRDLACKRVLAVIPSVVVSEIDKHKYGGTKLLRSRAATVLKRLLTYDESRLDPEALQWWGDLKGIEKSYLSTFRPGVDAYFDQIEPGFTSDDRLSPQHPDDRLIASLLQFARSNPSIRVELRTGDGGLRLRMRRFHIPAHEPPECTAHPPEQDEDQKTILELRKRVLELESAAPKLVVSFSDSDSVSTARPKLRIPRQPTTSDIEAIVAAAPRRHERLPTLDDGRPASALLMAIQAQGKDRIGSYNRRLDAYLDELRTFVETYRERNPVFRCISMELFAHNLGQKPAQNIELTLEFPEAVTVLERAPLIPTAPAKPSFAFMDVGPHLYATHSFGASLAVPRFDLSHIAPPFFDKAHVEGTTVTYRQMRLAHGSTTECARVFVVFDSIDAIRPFQVAYSFYADNLPRRCEGHLSIVPERVYENELMLPEIEPAPAKEEVSKTSKRK
jgi:hypothetical protein